MPSNPTGERDVLLVFLIAPYAKVSTVSLVIGASRVSALKAAKTKASILWQLTSGSLVSIGPCNWQEGSPKSPKYPTTRC